jgi:hypothetical protein
MYTAATDAYNEMLNEAKVIMLENKPKVDYKE